MKKTTKKLDDNMTYTSNGDGSCTFSLEVDGWVKPEEITASDLVATKQVFPELSEHDLLLLFETGQLALSRSKQRVPKFS